jgi:hypothetical protein
MDLIDFRAVSFQCCPFYANRTGALVRPLVERFICSGRERIGSKMPNSTDETRGSTTRIGSKALMYQLSLMPCGLTMPAWHDARSANCSTLIRP